MSSYWAKTMARRTSRRRFIAGTSALGAGAAFLAACGGDDDEAPASPTTAAGTGSATGSTGATGATGSTAATGATGSTGATGTSGLLQTYPDRSGDATQGGTLAHTTLPLSSLDVIGSTATLTRISANMLYNRLLRVLPGVNEPSSGEKVGDAAESWELSPDNMSLTFKIRNNLGSDPRPPLEGRALDAEDVVSSWNRWAEVSPLRGDLLNSVNPDGPVTSGSAPDASTVVFDLAFPSVILMDYLSDGFYFWVMPREANEGVFDPNIEAHGAGPYYADDFLEGAHLQMARNDNFYEAPIPYFDRQEWFIVPEAAAQLAQFEAGQIDLGTTSGINNENVVDVYNRHDDLQLWALPITNVAATSRFGFEEGSPFHDERVRRAISMAYDRDALAEYFTNRSRLEEDGLPASALWASHISAMWDISGDPSDASSFGENAQYFAHNLEEARKLLEAAGHLDMEITYHMDNFSPANLADAEALAGQLRDSGLVQVNQVVQEYAAWFLPNIYRGRGDWNGMAHGAVGYKFTPEVFIYSYFHTSPGTAHYPEGLFPDLVERATAITREFDAEARTELVKDFEHEAAALMPSLPLGASGPTYVLAWPWVAQAAVLNQWPGDGVAERATRYTRFWYDESLES